MSRESRATIQKVIELLEFVVSIDMALEEYLDATEDYPDATKVRLVIEGSNIRVPNRSMLEAWRDAAFNEAKDALERGI